MEPDRAGRAPLRLLPDFSGAQVPETPGAFLRSLGGPAVLRVAGRDRGRTRVVTTLIHGNEPSGLRAVHAWLRSGAVPAVDTLLFVASVAAALGPPRFSYRALPGARDLNRCFFPPHHGPEGSLARAALEILESARPEALIDLHNNTGHNPPYGVAPCTGRAQRHLASLFGERLVHSELTLGALVEAATLFVPSVTIECGRVGDARADAVARRGLDRYLQAPDLFLDRPVHSPMTLLVDPIRVCALPGIRVAFGEGRASGAELTMMADVDRHNFRQLPVHEPIGWLGDGGAWPVVARDARGEERSREIFEVQDGLLRTRRELVPIMMTLDPEIAASDCLFYAVQLSERSEGT